MYIIQTLWDAFWHVLGWFCQIAVSFGTYLGIGEGIAKFVIAMIVIVFLASDPFPVSRRDKKSARKTARAIVDILSNIMK